MFIQLTNASYGNNHCAIHAHQLVDACNNKKICCFPVKNENFDADPCPGMVKHLKVNIKGCLPIKRETNKERICKLSGHALADEDISYLA